MSYAENLKPLALVLLIGLAGFLRAGAAAPTEVAISAIDSAQTCVRRDSLLLPPHKMNIIVLAHFKAEQRVLAFKKYRASCDRDA